MTYTVNIEKKTVTYSDSLPGGHVIAIRKVFEAQGYSVAEKNDTEHVINKLQEELQVQLRSSSMRSANRMLTGYLGDTISSSTTGAVIGATDFYATPDKTKPED